MSFPAFEPLEGRGQTCSSFFSLRPASVHLLEGEWGGRSEGCLGADSCPALLLTLSPVLVTETPVLRHFHLTLPPTPGPSGPQPPREAWTLLKDALPGEDSEDELRLLAGLRCAGHSDVCPRLQPQLPTHFLLPEKRLRPLQGSIFPEELGRQSPLVIIALWVEDGHLCWNPT